MIQIKTSSVTLTHLLAAMALDLLLSLRPVSAFQNENVLYVEVFLTFVILFFSYYQCKMKNNLSFVDKVRGLIPIIYGFVANLHYYYHKHMFNTRLLLVFLLTSMWGLHMMHYVETKLRKRGAFQQDSRWSVVYTFIYHPQQAYIWELFVFFVGNLYQISSWCLQINGPLFVVYSSKPSLSSIDYILCAIYLFFFGVEVIADYEMSQFKKIKFQKMMGGHSIRYNLDEMIVEKDSTFYGWKYDFLSNGLRKYSRFPNYWAEMCLWATFYGFGVCNCFISGQLWVLMFGLIGYLSLVFKLFKLAKLTEGILAYSYGSC